MAITLEFIDFVVPTARVRAMYPGNWEQCLRDRERLIGKRKRVWYDKSLLRDGATALLGIQALVEKWTSLGVETASMREW